MHSYCDCKTCRSEFAARNAYKESDEFEAPHGKISKKKTPAKKRRNASCKHVYVIVKIVWKRQRSKYNRETHRVEFLKEWVPMQEYRKVCAGCGLWKRSYREDYKGRSPVGRYFEEEDIYQTIDLGKTRDWFAPEVTL